MSRRGPQPKRETWHDWFPDTQPEGEATFEELQAFMERLGYSITRDQVRYWQKIGVTPVPVRRQHEGLVRQRFPLTSTALVLRELLTLQEHGYTLQQIGPRLRAYARSHNLWRQHPDPFNWHAAADQIARNWAEAVGRELSDVAAVRIVIVDQDDREVGRGQFQPSPEPADSDEREHERSLDDRMGPTHQLP